jgi:hypothetical protein
MSVPAHITLDIADVDAAIFEYLSKRLPNIEVTGVTVLSWNSHVFQIENGKLDEPAHLIRPEHRKLKDPS